LKENFRYMKNSEEILPPESYEIDNAVHDLFTYGDITSVSNWSGIKYARLAAMLRVDDPQENCVTETFKVWYGMTRNNEEKGQALFRMFERQAIAWKLTDGSPLSILRSAVEHIPQINPQDIKRLNEDDQIKVLSYITVLRNSIEKIADAWCSARTLEPIGG
jgi:hypothetical protein